MSATTDPQPTETRIAPAQPPTSLLPETALPGGTTDRGFDESIRSLLHRRLRFCAGIGTAGALVLVGVSLASGGRASPAEALGLYADLAFFSVGATGLVLLRGRPSLARLRVIEVAVFLSMSLFCGALRFVGNAQLETESPDPRHARVVVEYATALANMAAYFQIFFYGLLIPTTLRRGAAMVAVMGLIPLVTLAASGAANPAVLPQLPVLMAVTLVGVLMSGAGAVFGLSRINTLQRRAFEAERRADQLGPYTLHRKLGAGGMGEVWLAEHRLLKRPCAVKFIRPELAANPMNAARFAREVHAVTALTHFNTIRLYDYGQGDDGSFYYVMEYLHGPTLESLVQRSGPLDPGRAVYLLRQLCGALAEAHAAGLVHRDLKPNNVIVAALGGQHDVAKLLDFGLVQDLSVADSQERLTQAGVVMGTPTYMSPEQAGGASAFDARSDIYSLGAVAFFMLTGRPPFEGATVGKLISAHLTQQAPDVRSLRGEVPADLAAVVARCLMKEPGERFQTAAELDAALAACASASEWNAARAGEWWKCQQGNPAVSETDPTLTVQNS